MEVRGIALTPPSLAPLPGPAPLFRTGSIRPDQVERLLSQVSMPMVTAALARIEDGPLRIEPAPIQTAITQMTEAVASGDRQRATEIAVQLVRVSPGADEAIRTHGGFAMVQEEWTQATNMVATEFRARAAARIEGAVQTLTVAGTPANQPGQADPSTLLTLAMYFLDGGKVGHMVRAEYLAQAVIDRCARDSDNLGARIGRAIVSTGERVTRLYGRAPLLFFLIGWLVIGLVWLPTEFLVIGLLGLVGLGFVARVRRARVR